MKIPFTEIKRILEYLDSESMDFEISDKKDKHIFKDIKKVKFWVEQSKIKN